MPDDRETTLYGMESTTIGGIGITLLGIFIGLVGIGYTIDNLFATTHSTIFGTMQLAVPLFALGILLCASGVFLIRK